MALEVKQPAEWPPEHPRHQHAEKPAKNGSNDGPPEQAANGPAQWCQYHGNQHKRHDLHVSSVSKDWSDVQSSRATTPVG